MLPQRTGLSRQSPLRPLSVLVFHLLLTQSCRGQSQMIGLSQPIVALVGDDVILPCHLEPAEDVAAMTLEWTRPNLNSIAVFVWRAGKDLVHVKDPSYTGRTSLFTDGLKHGNISLKLSKVKPSDEGRYKCYVPDLDKESLVELVVASGSVSSPVLTLSGIDEATRGVLLDCRSEGWYPEPEVLWLDGEGNLLSAGPPETVRGPDDLYTVSSRVTVEKRHSNSFTCRVQQKNTKQTRETHIQVPDDFFNVQSSSVPVNTGLAVSLAVWIIMFILLLLFVLWKWRLNRIKTKRNCRDQTDEGEKKNSSETNKAVDQCVIEEREREQLMTDGVTVEMEVLKGNGQKKIQHFKKKRSEQQLQEEKRREEQQKEVQTLKKELETKKNEIETKGAELQQLHEEKKRNENELQSLKEELEKKNKELERTRNTRSIFSFSLGIPKEDQQKKEEAETLKEKLENQQKESDAKIKEFKEKAAEVQQLQDQIQRMETNLQTLMESNNMELERSRAAPVRSSSSGFKWPIVSRQKIQDEQQRREEAENRVQILEEELQTKNRELQDEQHRRHEAEPEVQMKENELQDNTAMLKGNQADINSQLLQETQRREDAQREVEKLKNELESQKKELEDKQQAADAQMKKSNEDLKRQLKMKDESVSQLMRELCDQQQKKEEAERDLEELMTKNTEIEKQLQEEKTKREEAEKEVENLKKEMQTKLEDKQQADKIQLKTNEELKETKHHLELATGEISQLKGELRDQQQKKEEAERELKQLMTKIEKKLQEEKTKREEAEKEVENRKKEMEDKSSSASQSSNTELPIVVQVNQKENYIRLINTVPKDHRLGGWRLEMEVNRKIISFTFKSSFKLNSRGIVTMSSTGCDPYDPTELQSWKDLTPWNSGDYLKFTLISDTGVRHQLMFKLTETL